jgi:hypothetical protein
MVYRRWPWHRRQTRSAELGQPSKLDLNLGGQGPGLAGQDEAGLTILGFENVVRRHVDVAGNDSAHARAAPSFAARVRHVDTRREHYVDECGPLRPPDSMSVSVQFHLGERVFTYGHGRHCRGATVGDRRARPVFGMDKYERPVTGKRHTAAGRYRLRSGP